MDSFAEAAAAGLGGVVSASALYPLEIIKNSMQSKVKGSSKTFEEEADICPSPMCVHMCVAGVTE